MRQKAFCLQEHNKLSFSTYGERVNVHSWGQNVMTAGYGVCEFEGSEPRERHYTPRYSGTSSASALTAGARKRISFAMPFMLKMIIFAKTGSGQT